MSKGVDVFVSYRRKGGREVARNLNDRLTLNGFSVFFDYESIRDGKFNTQIFDAIRQADDFIFVLSSHALDDCVNPDDWVRIELEYALKHDKHVVLVCPEEVFSGFPADLPESLRPISDLQIHFLSHRYYDESIREILLILKGRSKSRKQYAVLAGLVLCLGLGLLFLIPRFSGKDGGGASDRMKVQCYLTKYKDLALFEGVSFSDREFSAFHYADSLDGDRYVVFPQSDCYSLNSRSCISPVGQEMPATPPPVFSLRIINNGGKTMVVNSAVIEVRSVTPTASFPVYMRSDGREYDFVGLGEEACPVDYRMVDGSTGRILFEGHDTVVSNGKSHTFSPEDDLPSGSMVIGYVHRREGAVHFLIPADADERPEPTEQQIDLPSVRVPDGKAGQTLSFSSFGDRNLVGGETDERFRFAVFADRNCTFEMRAVLKTVDKMTFRSDWIQVTVFSNSDLD